MKAYITKIAYALPERVEENPKNRLTKKTGILSRHICEENEIASDLAVKATETLFRDGVVRGNIDYLMYCTQSPDYFLPTTACIMQDRLGLPKSCGAMDYNLGCSGYIYGLSLAKGLIESGQVRNVLLITAETYSKYIHPSDQSVRPLFGDAAAATLIEGIDTEKSGLNGFVFGTDGSGCQNLIVPVGGMAYPYEKTDLLATTDEYGNYRTNRNLRMNGAAISDFALEVVPKVVEEVLSKTGMEKQDVGYYVFHQANQFVLRYLQQKCELLDVPFWNDVAEYGNTVSASIPIALKNMLSTQSVALRQVMIVGFGVGLSWGGCMLDMRFYCADGSVK